MLDRNYRGENLVFIVGCPRSGTTWLQRLLAGHPLVRTGQESGVFDSYIGPQLRNWKRDLDPGTSGRGGVGLGCYLREEEFMGILRDYMLRLLDPMAGGLGPGEVFVEKTPSHALFMPEIMEMLPESRFIHVIRDARDVVASLLAASRSWGSYWAPRHPWRAARMWVRHVEAVRKYESVLTDRRFFEVRYEDLYGSTVECLKGVYGFLGLGCTEEEIIKAVEKNRPGEAIKGKGTVIPVSGEFSRPSGEVTEPAGFVRKARAGSWKEDLSLKDKFWTWVVARKAMAKNGYPWALPI